MFIIHLLIPGSLLWSHVRQAKLAGPTSLVGCVSTWHADSRGFDNIFVEVGHEIISAAILSLPLIQVAQLLEKGCAHSTG